MNERFLGRFRGRQPEVADLYPQVPNYEIRQVGFRSEILVKGVQALQGGRIREGIEKVTRLIEKRGGRIEWLPTGTIQEKQEGNTARYSRYQSRVIEIEKQEPTEALYQILHEYIWGMRYWLHNFPGQGEDFQRLKEALTPENCAKADIAIAAALPEGASRRQERLNMAKLRYLQIQSGEVF